MLALFAQALFGLGLFTGVASAARLAPTPRPTVGQRGLARARALSRSTLFCALEPGLRWVGAVLSPLLGRTPRARLQGLLDRAGCWLGMSPEEAVALCLLCGLASLSLVVLVGMPWPLRLLLLSVAPCYPLLQLRSIAGQRQRTIGRRLPAAIDLLALCMGAGMDFVSGLQLFVDEHAEQEGPLVQELRRVLQELSLGRTRRDALAGLALRVPADAVTDFVGAVTQAEEKGTPLNEVLELQAQMLRMHRSVAAEEAAARASVLLLLPMLLLMGCVLLILIGPFMIEGVPL